MHISSNIWFEDCKIHDNLFSTRYIMNFWTIPNRMGAQFASFTGNSQSIKIVIAKIRYFQLLQLFHKNYVDLV